MGQHLKPKVLKALQGSIAKWEGVVSGRVKDMGGENCPLCQMFMVNKAYDEECVGCPVMKDTGYPKCRNTPYTDDWCRCSGDATWAITDEEILAARKEVDYLRSLLPKRLQPKRPL